ncbi:MAG: DUF2073 domain-containing protein [Candidatus Pacearchaeota archaeon]
MKTKEKNLTIYFMPYSEISHLGSLERIKKILGIVLENKLIILQGRLKPEEEAKLIEHTMALVGNIKDFKGIEISSLSYANERNLFEKIRKNLIRILVGEQDSISLIGPASLIKEIKKDPRKIELILKRA